MFTTQTDSYSRAYYWPSKPPRCTLLDSREANRQRQDKYQPTLQILDVMASSAEIKINAGNVICAVEECSRLDRLAWRFMCNK